MSKRRVLLIAVIAFLIVAGLTITLLVSPGLRRSIVEPLAGFLYLVRHTIGRLPQYMLWLVALLVGAAVILRTWRRFDRRDERSARRNRLLRGRRHLGRPSIPVSPAVSFAHAVDRAPRSRLMRGSVRRELIELAVRLVARNEAIPIPEARRRVRDEARWTSDQRVLTFLGERGRYGGRRQDAAGDIEYTVRFLESYYQEV